MALRDIGTVKDTTVVTITDPRSGKPLKNADGSDMTVTLHGPYSARYKRVMRDQQQARAESMGRGALRATLTADEVEEMQTEQLVACIDDWKITLEGDDPMPFSADAARAVLIEFPWLKDQLNIALGDVAGFLEPPKQH